MSSGPLLASLVIEYRYYVVMFDSGGEYLCVSIHGLTPLCYSSCDGGYLLILCWLRVRSGVPGCLCFPWLFGRPPAPVSLASSRSPASSSAGLSVLPWVSVSAWPDVVLLVGGLLLVFLPAGFASSLGPLFGFSSLHLSFHSRLS